MMKQSDATSSGPSTATHTIGVSIGTLLLIMLSGVLSTALHAEPFFTQEELERNQHLTPATRKLILAYDNYIRLYPTSERARDFVIDKAGRFRDANDNETAILVLQRALQRPDLRQSDRAYVYEQIMDAHRELGQYEQQEEWAQRMAAADVGPEKQQQAKDFIFAAGYNRAKAEQDKGNFSGAALAYERLAVRNPDHDQAPLAMLAAARMWETAENKPRAALTYERFYYTYPDYRDPEGNDALIALETAAAIYAELDDYRHTADAVERILSVAPNHQNKKNYLRNLASIYQLLRDYNNAIRVRQEFISAYPGDPEAGSYLWDIAEFRGIVGQRQQQLAEYEAFVRNYPWDWRAIEANYRIGANRLSTRVRALDDEREDDAEDLLHRARAHFERAFTLHDSLVSVSGPDGGDLRHAIDAIVEVARMDSANYYSISLKTTEDFSRDSTLKWETLQHASDTYLKLANYGYPPRTFEALYRRGRMFEDFAYNYLEQPRPDTAITYDEILRTFSINAISQAILQSAAAPAYRQQMIEFYERNREDIDAAAQEVEEEELRDIHLHWLERARERLAAIPAVVDSLELNTIGYEADLLVLDAQQKIPERFETAWARFEQDRRQRYIDQPYTMYTDRQAVFDLGVSPLVYGQHIETVIGGVDTTILDTTAMVPRFMDIIEKGAEIGPDWQEYNRGRLRLVYAARSQYYTQVAHNAVNQGLAAQVDSLYAESQELVHTIERLPTLDLSALGDPPARPDLTPPEPPERPPGEPSTWPREVALQFVADFRAYQEAVQNMQNRVTRYQRAVERYRERRQALIDQQTAQYRGVLEAARAQAQLFGAETRETQIYRVAVERVIDNAIGAHERDIAFGDSVGYTAQDMRAVRDSALAYSFQAAKDIDSLYQVVLQLRQHYTNKRDTETGGEGTPAFQVANNLVTGYAAVADSFRSSAIRRYLHVFEARDSVFNVALEHPIVEKAIERLRSLDPTFGITTVPMTFTFVTEDSSGHWRVSSRIDRDSPDAWRHLDFDDSDWPAARKGTMDWFLASQYPDAAERRGPPTGATRSESQNDNLSVNDADDLSAENGEGTDAPDPTEQIDGPSGYPIWGFPKSGNLNLTDIWSEDRADTVYLRREIELPPQWSELPDSLRAPEAPKPVITRATITMTADDDYRAYVNGLVTNVFDQSGGIDWHQAQPVEVLRDQWFVGDTANVLAVQAVNEQRVDRFPETQPETYGLIARIDIQMDIPYGIYETLYKPPDPEPEFVLALTPQDSTILADTTGQYFETAEQLERWKECRVRELHASWRDSVLIPFRVNRVQERLVSTNTSLEELHQWLVEQRREAQTRLAEAAGAAVGEDFEFEPSGENEVDRDDNGQRDEDSETFDSGLRSTTDNDFD